MAGRGGDGAHRPLAQADDVARRGQPAGQAVELEQGEAARRPAQVEGAGDGLLAGVAALGQVHGGAQPVELVRDGALVDLAGPARAPGLDAQRLPRHRPGQGVVLRDGGERPAGLRGGPAGGVLIRGPTGGVLGRGSAGGILVQGPVGRILRVLIRGPAGRGLFVRESPGGEGPDHLHDPGRGDEHEPGRIGAPGVRGVEADVVAGAALHDAGPRIRPGPGEGAGAVGRPAQPLPARPQGPEGDEVLARTDLDAQHEAHAIQEGRERGPVPGLGDQEEGPAVVEGGQGVGDAPLGVEQQGLGAAVARGQAGQPLAGQGGEPGEAVRTGDGDDVAGQGADGQAVGQEPLLAQGVAVVGGDEGVGVGGGDGASRSGTGAGGGAAGYGAGVGSDGAGGVQERAGAHQDCALRSVPAPAARASGALGASAPAAGTAEASAAAVPAGTAMPAASGP